MLLQDAMFELSKFLEVNNIFEDCDFTVIEYTNDVYTIELWEHSKISLRKTGKHVWLCIGTDSIILEDAKKIKDYIELPKKHRRRSRCLPFYSFC